jgi:hypothetical protein
VFRTDAAAVQWLAPLYSALVTNHQRLCLASLASLAKNECVGARMRSKVAPIIRFLRFS